MKVRVCAAALLMLCLAVPAMAQQAVQLPSLESTGGLPVQLPGHWFLAPQAAARAPAMVLLHGCGGAVNGRGQLTLRLTEYAQRLNALGVHVLVTDSLTPRGETELCTQKNGTRKVTQLQRRRDALGALAWLAAQPQVDAARLGLMGWSNGGSTVLASTNAQHPEVAAATAKAAFAVAFYPGCQVERMNRYQPTGHLLMLVGEADDWTPAGPCKALAQEAGAKVQLSAFAGAHHGFDSEMPVRLRADVPNGVNPGQGVHVGGHPQARAAALMQLDEFIKRQ